MFKGLSKKQLNTLLILGIITILSFVGIFFLPWVNPSLGLNCSGREQEIEAPPHDRFRAANSLVSPPLLWEINLGGSGSDAVLASFAIGDEANGYIIVFGNTESTDYDFYEEEAGFFVIRLSFLGTPLSYFVGEGLLQQVLKLNNSFLLAVNTEEESFVIKTNLLGVETARSDNLRVSENEKLISMYEDFFSPQEPYHAVIQRTGPFNDYHNLRIVVLTVNLENSFQRHFTNNQSLDFVFAFAEQDKFLLFANLRGFETSHLIIYSWSKTENQQRIPFSLPTIQRFVVLDILPYGYAEFVFLIRCNRNLSHLVYSYQGFSQNWLRSLGEAPSISSSLFMGVGSNSIYVFERFPASSRLSRFSGSTPTLDGNAFPAFNNLVSLYSHSITQNGTMFVGRTAGQIIISTIFNNAVSSTTTFASVGEDIKTIIPVSNGAILVGTSDGEGVNVKNNFGDNDVWVTGVGL